MANAIGVSSSAPARTEADLSAADRDRLKAAHRRLSAAVGAYESLLGRDLPAGVAAAQAKVQQAEADLWTMREQLLEWSHPSWAPAATLVSGWFSDEDTVYDE